MFQRNAKGRFLRNRFYCPRMSSARNWETKADTCTWYFMKTNSTRNHHRKYQYLDTLYVKISTLKAAWSAVQWALKGWGGGNRLAWDIGEWFHKAAKSAATEISRLLTKTRMTWKNDAKWWATAITLIKVQQDGVPYPSCSSAWPTNPSEQRKFVSFVPVPRSLVWGVHTWVKMTAMAWVESRGDSEPRWMHHNLFLLSSTLCTDIHNSWTACQGNQTTVSSLQLLQLLSITLEKLQSYWRSTTHCLSPITFPWVRVSYHQLYASTVVAKPSKQHLLSWWEIRNLWVAENHRAVWCATATDHWTGAQIRGHWMIFSQNLGSLLKKVNGEHHAQLPSNSNDITEKQTGMQHLWRTSQGPLLKLEWTKLTYLSDGYKHNVRYNTQQ